MRIILIGMKGCGKSTVGKVLAGKLQSQFIELDSEIEKEHTRKKNEQLSSRDIFKTYGEKYFRRLESEGLHNLAEKNDYENFVFSCGGGTPLLEENKKIIASLGIVVFLDVDKRILLRRILGHGIPAFFAYPDNPEKSLDNLLDERLPVYTQLADITIDIKNETPDEIAEKIIGAVGAKDFLPYNDVYEH